MDELRAQRDSLRAKKSWWFRRDALLEHAKMNALREEIRSLALRPCSESSEHPVHWVKHWQTKYAAKYALCETVAGSLISVTEQEAIDLHNMRTLGVAAWLRLMPEVKRVENEN